MNMIEDYILKENWMIKENSNDSFSLQGLHILLANQEIKRYWLDKVYDNDIKVAQKQGKFHIHDLGYLCAFLFSLLISYNILSSMLSSNLTFILLHLGHCGLFAFVSHSYLHFEHFPFISLSFLYFL